jgi:hypothetical protein
MQLRRIAPRAPALALSPDRVLSPLGAAIAGPLAVAVGTSSALWIASAAILASNLSMLLIQAVWNIQARAPEAAPVSL